MEKYFTPAEHMRRVEGYRALDNGQLDNARRDVQFCVDNPQDNLPGKWQHIPYAESVACLQLIDEEIARREKHPECPPPEFEGSNPLEFTEEQLDTAVELWERLCGLQNVTGETAGEYTHSTRHLSPGVTGRTIGNACRMPDAVELRALVLSDGEETAYPRHGEPYGDGTFTNDTNPWSYDNRLYPITLTLISCGDYHGSDVDAANNRALKGHPGVDVSEPNTGGMGSVFNVSTTVVGRMSAFANAQGEEPHPRDAISWLTELVQLMEGLQDNYPLIDEEIHSEFVAEMSQEMWDACLSRDIPSELEKLAEEHLEFPATADVPYGEVECDDAADYIHELWTHHEAKFREAYYAFEDNDWGIESLGSGATNGNHDDAVKHAARTAFGWEV